MKQSCSCLAATGASRNAIINFIPGRRGIRTVLCLLLCLHHQEYSPFGIDEGVGEVLYGPPNLLDADRLPILANVQAYLWSSAKIFPDSLNVEHCDGFLAGMTLEKVDVVGVVHKEVFG